MTIFAVVDTVDEAIKLANESDYTLTSSVWTKNIDRAQQCTWGIRAGEAFVQYNHVLAPDTFFTQDM